MTGFIFAVEPCCGDWVLLTSEHITPTLTRAHIRCERCGQVRVITATSVRHREVA